MSSSSELWVFGYGSLMWKPGFAYDETRPALLKGWHRELCIYSHHWRGTVDRPGLVLGLDAGGSCHGVAYRVAGARVGEVRAYLHEREMKGSVYHELMLPITFPNKESTEALTYVSDETHEQYAGRLTREERLDIVRICKGEGGPNRDYVINTVLHLRYLGVYDAELEWLAEQLGGVEIMDIGAGI